MRRGGVGWGARVSTYMAVLVLEEGGERLDAGRQGEVVGLHLGAEARHHRHGGVQRVLVRAAAVIAEEQQHAVQATRLEHGTSLSGTYQLQYLHKQATSQPSIDQNINVM